MIRPYMDSDREAVRALCAATALYGQPIAPLITDAGLAADALSSYYTEFEPESLFVAEESGAVTGYLAGCVDTRRFERVTARRIAPRLIATFVARGLVFRRGSWRVMAGLLAAGVRRARVMRAILPAYPAHCHVNVAAQTRRSGAGTALWGAFHERLEARAVSGVHVSTPTAAGKLFFGRVGFTILARYPAATLGGVSPGEVWIMGLKLAA